MLSNKSATIQDKCSELVRLGYKAHIISGDNRIIVSGYGKKYFNAKQTKANTITSSLNRLPFITAAWDLLAYDGFYDFYAK